MDHTLNGKYGTQNHTYGSSFFLYFDILLFAVPSLKELVNLPIDRSLWYAIGQELGIKYYKLNEIKADNERKPNHSLACTTSMFSYWIQVEEEPTYHTSLSSPFQLWGCEK